MRSTSCLCGVSKDTGAKLLVDLGEACMRYQNETIFGLQSKRLQLHEIWQFVGCKKRNVDPDDDTVRGDAWTYTALDADTKLIVAWEVGPRDQETMSLFIKTLAERVDSRPQITSDGWRAYPAAIKHEFGRLVDFAVVVKTFSGVPDGAKTTQSRYSPPPVLSVVKRPMIGAPDPAHISTSYIERANLTLRMSCRRLTRLTNAFSKKTENHIAAQAISFMHYNFARKHGSLAGRTPAMAAGLSNKVWTYEDIVGLLAETEPKAKRVWSKARAADSN